MKSTINQSQSSKPKGGKRAGAGRKPSTLKGIARRLPKETAEILLAEINAQQKWRQLAESDDERIVLDTLRYLTDRAYGRAAQAVEVSGKDGGPIQGSVAVTFVQANGFRTSQG